MRVGVSQGLSVSVGGGYQYEVAMLDALSDLTPQLPYQLLCVSNDPDSLRGNLHARRLRYGNMPIVPLHDLHIHQEPPEAYLLQPGDAVMVPPSDVTQPDLNLGRALRGQGVDLLLSLYTPLFGPKPPIPFIVPIHDLQHRIQPEFPEVGGGAEAEIRDLSIRTICRYATLVLVDSDAGRRDVLRFYGDVIDDDRIRVLPYFPPARRAQPPDSRELARVRRRYSLPDRYYFYPAQFWPHKNHRLIVEALGQLRREGGECPTVVFAGGYADPLRARTFIDVMELAGSLGVGGHVYYLGFVPDRDMPALYSLSAGLVMPTFFGPTNLPPLEAWAFGCPVITTDLPSIRDHLGDGALYVDPRDAGSLAQAMRSLWQDPRLVAQLMANAARRLASFPYEDFLIALRRILDDGVERVRAGRTPVMPDSWHVDDSGGA
jgi:glycosyltransferase involved in cell wall biosynthesis